MGSNIQKMKRGGADLERVYLYDAEIKDAKEVIEVKKSRFHVVKDMGDVILRHIGRYGLALPFIRPGYRVLDFPCGSGLALEVFSALARCGGFTYEGWDCDRPTVLYCEKVYGKKHPWARFALGDLTAFVLKKNSYDTILCIEGIEHIDKKFQKMAIEQFTAGLVRGGTLIISSPAAARGMSGRNERNPYHRWELTTEDFVRLLGGFFGRGNVELVSQENVLSKWRTSQNELCSLS